jgi:hypothetical protein
MEEVLMNRLSRRLGVVLALAGAVTATGLWTGTQAAGLVHSPGVPSSSDTSGELPQSGRVAHALGSTVSKIVLRVYDPRGHVVSKRVLPGGRPQQSVTPFDCSLLCHATGCAASSCPDPGGSARIDVIQKGYSTLGADLWSWDVWTKWSWNHRGCPCTVSVIDKGHVGRALDQHWAFDGVIHRNQGYRDGSGGPHTYYHDAVTGQFQGPSVLNGTVYRRPDNVLNSYNNGTYEWWLYCC